MRDISRVDLLEADLSGPIPEREADLFRSDRVVDEAGGTRLDEEEVSVLLWERLEGVDAVIERLAGPLPDPQS